MFKSNELKTSELVVHLELSKFYNHKITIDLDLFDQIALWSVIPA